MNLKNEYKITLKKIFLHLHLVNKHRFLVLRLSCKAGIPLRGLIHDLSKYSPTEFWESVKYYAGDCSPISNAKKDKGYSAAWLHHKGRNKHHCEYWYDPSLSDCYIMMPLKYFKEMVCDTLAAGMSYQGKNWTKEYQLSYWNKAKDKALLDDKMKNLLTRVYTDISLEGVKPVVNRKNLQKLYNEYMQ
ncbi:MAG: catalase [Clostridia bacterium]|nr:catalase [Clostridia bacterium]